MTYTDFGCALNWERFPAFLSVSRGKPHKLATDQSDVNRPFDFGENGQSCDATLLRPPMPAGVRRQSAINFSKSVESPLHTAAKS